MSPYTDILSARRPDSRRAKMDLQARAAQFAPFAALTGYDGLVEEAARLTDGFTPAEFARQEELDRQLRQLAALASRHPRVRLTRFVPDGRKAGGSLRELTGTLKALDPTEGCLVLTDRTRVPFSCLESLEILA